MQGSIISSCNALSTFSQIGGGHQRRRPTVDHSPPTILAMPKYQLMNLGRSDTETDNSRWNITIPAASTMNAPNNTTSVKFNEDMRMKKYMEVVLDVRDYELDQYGVVNNAVYSSYCQHGHCELLKTTGLTADTVARTGAATAISEINIKFFAPLRSGDKFVVKSRPERISTARIVIEDRIYRLPDYELVLEAKATAVWLDGNYRPIRIPASVKSKLLQLYFNDKPEGSL